MATYLDENGATVVIVANDCNWYAQNGMMQHVVDMRRESAAILTRSDSKGKK